MEVYAQIEPTPLPNRIMLADVPSQNLIPESVTKNRFIRKLILFVNDNSMGFIPDNSSYC